MTLALIRQIMAATHRPGGLLSTRYRGRQRYYSPGGSPLPEQSGAEQV